MRQSGRALGAAFLVLGAAIPAAALPTMIRLGYSECAACHLSPQGGGLLNLYGRGIDQLQSYRGGEYMPSTKRFAEALTFGGRVTQDLRGLVYLQNGGPAGGPRTTSRRMRLMYRNVTALNEAFRISATVTAETQRVPRPALAYDPPATSAPLFLNTALVHYRARPEVEIAAGRDQLPSGINLPDLTLTTKSRHRLGYFDAPIQVKVFWNAKRFHVTPFAYVPSGNEARGERESGVGTLAEVDLLGRQRTIVGISVLRGSAANGARRTIGGYTRLGFGPWGILAQHDITSRDREPSIGRAAFDQRTTHAQVFWAIRDWLVTAAIGERLSVGAPYAETLNVGRLELNARLASQATIGVSARTERSVLAGRRTRSILLQAAFKTVP